MLHILETLRKRSSENIDRARKAELGQFLTPTPVAEFMASLFLFLDNKEAHLLDAGAGIGTLSTAFFQEFRNRGFDSANLHVTAYEIDDLVSEELKKLFACLSATTDAKFKVRDDDFIEDAAHRILFERSRPFTHAILNPPYKKISSDSRYRSLLRSVGIETVNLYSAFVALTVKLLADGGQLVAIVPRSFCNGPYYKSFRKLLLRETSIKHIHLFESRTSTFKQDDVLQENVIIALEKGVPQNDVTVSTSAGGSFENIETNVFSFERILYPGDPESFFHIPTSQERDFHFESPIFNNLLSDLLVEVSTGPVVDFRVREYTRAMPDTDTVPLLYPGHFDGNKVLWPRHNWKKPNAILLNDETRKWLFPSGFYTVVRRFSPKEEKRRIRASVLSPTDLEGHTFIGFENHFNVFHFRKSGLQKEIALGLAVFLNSSIVDKYFRRMNGHTQVNATDLRQLKYPSLELLRELGRLSVAQHEESTQQTIDGMVNAITNQNA